MRDLVSDIRYSLRALLARPAYALAVIATLAPIIGMTTAVYGFLDAVVLEPLPLHTSHRLISLCEQFPGNAKDWCGISPPNLYDLRARTRTIESLGLARSWSVTLATTEGKENIPAGIATDGVFEALGIRPSMGRLIEPADLVGRPGLVAVISHSMWQTRFGGARDIIGRRITLDGDPVTIVGVLEDGASVPRLGYVQLWRPLHVIPTDERNREWRGFIAYGSLRAGVSMAAARADVQSALHDIASRHFTNTPGWTIETRPLKELVVGSVEKPMYLFFGAVLFVLLIACANVSNLMFARGEARSREMAVRSAIGASRGRLIRTLLVESLALAVVASTIGIGLSYWATAAFRSLAPQDIPRLDQVRLSGRVLEFSALTAIVTTVIFGLAPALRISSVNLAQSLRDGGRTSSGRGRNFGRVLIAIEVAVALPLVTSAVLLSRSFITQIEWRPGFERDHLLTFSLFAPAGSYGKFSDLPALWDRLEAEIRAVPGVRSVGTASGGPLFGGNESFEMQIEGLSATQRPSIRWFDVSPGFFSVLGLPVVRGRDFDAADRYGGEDVGLINETLANRYWPGQNPIGKHLVFVRDSQRASWTVKGVVPDVPPIQTGVPVEPQLYWSNRQSPRPFTFFLVRTTVPPAAVMPAIRQRFRAANPDFKPANVETMSDLVAENLLVPKFGMSLMLVFGIAAITLTGIGTYGLLAYFVEQRRREIGVRLALGAPTGDVVRAVVRDGLTLALPGVAIGAAGALLLARALRSYVFGLSPFDPLSLAASVGVVVAVAFLASAIPAIRAGRVDPAVTLLAD